MDIPKFVEINSRKYSEQIAFIDCGVRLTYKEIHQQVNALTHHLLNHDLTYGDKVILLLPNSADFALTYLAVLRFGGIAVPLNTKLQSDELHYIIEDSDAKAVVFHSDLTDVITPLIETHHLLWISAGNSESPFFSLTDWISTGSTRDLDITLNGEDDASILYTSGTTGRPKGVLFTHKNILSTATMMALETSMKPESRILHMMPLSHSAPLHLMFIAGIMVGAAHIFSRQFTPQELLTTVSNEKITHFFGAPVAYLLTAKHPQLKNYDLSSVEYWIYGGAPLSKEDVLFIQERFQSNKLMGVYGLTEAGPNGTLLSPDEHPEKAGSIGRRAALFCEITLLDDNGNPVKAGAVGEIALRSEGAMKAYYKNSEATFLTFKKGWLLTGDLAKRDEDGFYWIIDRKKDVIISGGVNVYPKEIEDVLKSHPLVFDAAVVGVPHPDWGETVKAFIVLNQPNEEAEKAIHAYVSERLAEYKCPRLYQFVDDLPRNANGKVLKHQLRHLPV
ncbi:MAG: class I adenylate-forming enzyme family protein [Tuberibacillus sp.]